MVINKKILNSVETILLDTMYQCNEAACGAYGAEKKVYEEMLAHLQAAYACTEPVKMTEAGEYIV